MQIEYTTGFITNRLNCHFECSVNLSATQSSFLILFSSPHFKSTVHFIWKDIYCGAYVKPMFLAFDSHL